LEVQELFQLGEGGLRSKRNWAQKERKQIDVKEKNNNRRVRDKIKQR
jgi:hypothetical protein